MDDDVYSFIKSYISGFRTAETEEEIEFVNSLKTNKILQSEIEDDDFFEEYKLLFNMNSMSTTNLSLTILPTVSCNLRCPYCFEANKPGGMMSDSVIDNLVKFAKDHGAAKTYSLTWFGGEPLLGLAQIRKILTRFENLHELKCKSHSIITNATLLNDEAIELFSQYPLQSMQVTLDGFRERHNAKRFHSDGSGTFDEILVNIEKFMNACPDTYVSFRVNVDNTNSADYISVHQLLTKLFEHKKYGIYAGILRANRGCESETFFTTKDHLAFNKRMAENGIPIVQYPNISSKGCCANCISSYVIGPKGELYNCWEHVGNMSKIIGNISDDDFTDRRSFITFISKGHCFSDPKCQKCGLLPICGGGCTNKRIENLLENAGHDLCTIYNDNDGEALVELLYQYYLSTLEGKQTCENEV